MKSLSWSSLESVFLTRRAVRRAWGLWYQHSFMIFTMADRIYNTETNVKYHLDVTVECKVCFMLCFSLIYKVSKRIVTYILHGVTCKTVII